MTQSKHPRGLVAASLANMGERFGFYVMMAILLLFLQAKFGLSSNKASLIYSFFYGGVYALSLVGGILADRFNNFKGVITAGLFVMTVGYVLLGIPTPTGAANASMWLIFTCFALFLIAFGNGLFKGNLQALVGKMYDNDTYREMRDSGFSLFYMFINIGAVFAPLIAVGIRNFWLTSHGLQYQADLPELCHQVLNNNITSEAMARYGELAVQVGGQATPEFALEYLQIFNTGFHYAFLAAVVAMLISLTIFLVNRSKFPGFNKAAAAKRQETVTKQEITMSAEEIRSRLLALGAVFAVVIFFWLSFHQNGVSLTQFAKDYVNNSQIKIDLGITQFVGAEIYQSINPFFVVVLTPVLLWIFALLRRRGKEPSTPRKIVIGMFLAGIAFVIMAIGSYVLDLPTAQELQARGGMEDALKASPWLLVFTYMVLTIAELFISPMGISFVSKVAPPHMQGLMQALWLCATALANTLLFVGMLFYNSLPIWATWLVFVGACFFSMAVMLSMLKWLERVAK